MASLFSVIIRLYNDHLKSLQFHLNWRSLQLTTILVVCFLSLYILINIERPFHSITYITAQKKNIYILQYLRSCSIVMWYQAVPLLFVALHEYKPKSFTVLGASVSVLMLCVELTPSNITRPSLNQVILAKGFAYTTHFMVVTWPIHDLTTAFEEALLLKRGLSNNRQNEKLNEWNSATIFKTFNLITN